LPLDERMKSLHVASHPIRYRIMHELGKGKPLYINELSDKLDKTDRKIIAFHLMTLQENGLVDTYLELKNPSTGNPVAVRYAKLTEKGKGILEKLAAAST